MSAQVVIFERPQDVGGYRVKWIRDGRAFREERPATLDEAMALGDGEWLEPEDGDASDVVAWQRCR